MFAAARPEAVDGGLGHSVSLRKAVEAALPFVASSFTDQPLIEARLRMTLGTSFQSLGDSRIAADQFKRHERSARNTIGPGSSRYTHGHVHELAVSYAGLGQYAEALTLQQATLALRKARNKLTVPGALLLMHRSIACTVLASTMQRSSSPRRRWRSENPSSGQLTSTHYGA